MPRLCLPVEEALDVVLKAFGPKEFELVSSKVADDAAPDPEHVAVEPQPNWVVCLVPRSPAAAERLEQAARELGVMN